MIVLLLLGVMVALWTLNPAIRVQFSEGQVTKHLFLLGGASRGALVIGWFQAITVFTHIAMPARTESAALASV